MDIIITFSFFVGNFVYNCNIIKQRLLKDTNNSFYVFCNIRAFKYKDKRKDKRLSVSDWAINLFVDLLTGVVRLATRTIKNENKKISYRTTHLVTKDCLYFEHPISSQ